MVRGKRKRSDDFIFLNIGTGVGSGIYAHGRLITGSGFGAGEIGHIPLVNNGIRCYCGQIGCLHTVATGPAIERRARAHMDHQEASMMRKLADGDPYQVDGALVSHAARAGDQIARQILREAGMYIGRALAMAVNLLNPSCIFIGGGVSRARELILDSIVQEIKKRSMRQHVENIRVELATLATMPGLWVQRPLYWPIFFKIRFATSSRSQNHIMHDVKFKNEMGKREGMNFDAKTGQRRAVLGGAAANDQPLAGTF